MLKICSILFILLLFCVPVQAQPDLISLNYKPPSYLNHFSHSWNHVPGAVEFEFVGTHDVLLSYMGRRARRYAREQLWDYYNQSSMTLQTYRRESDEISSKWKYYGNWWNRSWQHSLPPEQGGAPRRPQKRKVGWSIDIPRYVPVLWWIKTKIESLGDIWLDDERAYTNLQRNSRTQQYQDPNSPKSEARERVAVIIAGEDYSWYNGMNYHFRFRPSVRIKPGSTLRDIFTEYSLKVVIEVFVQNHAIHFADLVFSFRHDIQNEDIIGSASFVLLVF